ncbi:Aconitase/3-isopropylmalate dehydratase protein [Prunus dulcis]|uniref:Aconitase/3-isopropylmalate dehydratase protein n=1 Tax=Prunus dulcis TaxID=3755 RepID=A0A4Y1RGR8_PRUDU|nr:Aconitase/3-isopropylmalate dehydratase protein [Prunus dulcis]
MQEVLERQERETRERMRRRAASKREQRELDEQLGIAVALLEVKTRVVVVHEKAVAQMWTDIDILG